MTTESYICWLPVSALIDKHECTVQSSEAVAFFMDLVMLQISPVLLVVDDNRFSVQCKSADACMPQKVVKRSGIVAPRIFVRNIGKLSLFLSQISNIPRKVAIESAVFTHQRWKLREITMVLIV